MKVTVNKEIELRDYFASQAMMVVMSETQEVKVASFWDWIKFLLQMHLGFAFLEVKYKQIEGVYDVSAEKCYQYADALIIEKEKTND